MSVRRGQVQEDFPHIGWGREAGRDGGDSGMMLDIRVGVVDGPVTLGIWVMRIKEVTRPLEDTEIGKGLLTTRAGHILSQFQRPLSAA